MTTGFAEHKTLAKQGPPGDMPWLVQVTNEITATATTVPSGTQTVAGTVTALPSGTYTTAVTSSVTTTDKTQSTGLTAAGTVAVSTNGCGTAYLTLTGNGFGLSFTIQGLDSNSNWNNISAITLAGAIVTAGTTLNFNGQWLVPCAGFAQVRANLTAIASGTATFSWEAGNASQVVNIINTVTTSPTGTQTVAYGSGTFIVDGSGFTQPVSGTIGVQGTAFDIALDHLASTPYDLALSLGGELWVSDGGVVTTSLTAVAGPTVVKGFPGRLCRALVTTTGTVDLFIYDNASASSGTVIGFVTGTAVVGTTINFQMPAALGITAATTVNTPVVTVSYY